MKLVKKIRLEMRKKSTFSMVEKLILQIQKKTFSRKLNRKKRVWRTVKSEQEEVVKTSLTSFQISS